MLSLFCAEKMSNRKVTMEEIEKGNKRVCPGMSESFSQAGVVINPPMSDYGPMDDNNPAIIGGSNDVFGGQWGWDDDDDYGAVLDIQTLVSEFGGSNDVFGGQWGWDDDDDNGAVLDIQTLVSEFGGFGDFFECDELPFGEPPGTAESQALPFATQDCADIGGSSPGAANAMMDASDPMLYSIDSFYLLPPPPTIDDSLAKERSTTYKE